MTHTKDASIAYVVTVPTILTTLIALVLTCLRMYVRIYMIKLVDWDDYFNVFAMVTTLVVMGLTVGATYNGLGQHFSTLDPARASYGIMLLRICELMLIVTTVLVKISISLFLKRLFLKSKRWRIFFWSFIAFNTITSLADAAAIFPQCTPIQLNWNKSIKGHCWSNEAINALGIAQGSIASATDITLSILPTVFLWNIKIEWRVKLGICAIMALGFASGTFAIMRTVLVPSLTTTHDPTWDLVPLFMWATLEATFGVIAAAAPSLRPLFGRTAASKEYSKSTPQNVRLRTMPSTHGSHHYWNRAGGAITGDMQRLPDEDMDSHSDGGNSQRKLWAYKIGGIVKTTNVEIISSPGEHLGEQLEAMDTGHPRSF